ncbi:Ankyrin repeat protein [compost metagenome]
MIELLVEQGAQVDGTSADGRTALMLAAMFNRTAIVEYLLGQGANPAHRDAQGTTPLAAAQTMGAADTAAQLQALAG